METIWILARNRTSASRALTRHLGARFETEQFLDFKFIATANMIKSVEGEKFLTVQGWRGHPEAEAICKILKSKGWEFVTFKGLFG